MPAIGPPAGRAGAPAPLVRRIGAGALVLVAGASLLGGCADGSPPPSDGSAAASSATTTVTEVLPEPQDVDDLQATTADAAPSPDWALAIGDTVWVAGVEPGIVGYGRSTAEVRATVTLQGEVLCTLADGFGALWATEAVPPDWGAALVRIDPATGEVAWRAPVPGTGVRPESSLAVTDDAVWGIVGEPADERVLVGFDPDDGAVLAEHPAPRSATAVRGGFGSLWVSTTSGAVMRVDPADGSIQAQIPIGQQPSFLTVGPDAVWVLNSGDGTVSRVDPATETVAATIRVSEQAVQGGDIVADGESVWVRTTGDLAARIDARTNAVDLRLGPAAGSGSVAVAGRDVWLTAHDIHTVYRVPVD